jgi:hypothetical protein
MFVRGLLRTGKLKIHAVPRLIAQLRAVSSTPIAAGGIRITSPRRVGQAHGDIVSALVLGCWAAKEGEPSWIRAMNKMYASDAAIADAPVELSRAIFGDQMSLEVVGVVGRAVFKYGDPEPRWSIGVENNEPFKARIRGWWRSRYGAGPAVRQVS